MTPTEHWLLALAGVFCVMVRCNYFTFVRFSAFYVRRMQMKNRSIVPNGTLRISRMQYIFYEIISLCCTLRSGIGFDNQHGKSNRGNVFYVK
jgi:hypothetical protein